MNDPHFGTICLCAVRYTLGRETYMPHIVQTFIRDHVREIDNDTIRIMIRDIDEADKTVKHMLSDGSEYITDGLGDTTIDRPGWLDFREFLKSHVGS